MRALVNTAEADRRVRRAEVPSVRPAADEVVLDVAAFSLNRGELGLLAARPPGWRPGQDVAGTVRSAAADGSGPAAGTRVVALVEQAGWAEQVPVPVRRLAVLPATVDVASAATLGIAGRTALRTVTLGRSLLGRRVLVTGAAGGVGRFQVQLAALAGAQVTAVTRRADRAEDLRAAGAAATVAAVGDADGLFDLVLDGVGGRTLAAAVAKVEPGGTVVLLGASDPEPASLSLLDFVGHANAVIHGYVGQSDAVAAELTTLVGLLAAGRLTVRLGLRADWDHTDAALAALADGRVEGKAVLDVR